MACLNVMDTPNHTEAAAPQVDEKPFPFERLRMELRLEVYDHLTVREYRSLLKPQYALYYEALDAHVALLRVKFSNQEINAHLREYLQTHPIVLCVACVPGLHQKTVGRVALITTYLITQPHYFASSR